MDNFWQRRNKFGAYAALGLIVVVTAVFYAPALEYGFIWDDPVWYSHAVGKSWWQTLLPTTDFQFYRPVSTLYVWLFLRPDGTFAIEWLHGMQIGWHLVNIILAYAIGRWLRLGRWGAVIVAALFASYPFLYQAVAWAAPNQPTAAVLQTSAWLAYFSARPFVGERPLLRKRRLLLGSSFVLFLLALMVQESSVAVAFVPLLYEFLLRQDVVDAASLLAVIKQPRKRGWLLAAGYVALAGIYGLLWAAAPRQAGITQLAMESKTALYLLQGIVYPVWGRPFGYGSESMAVLPFLIVSLIILIGLVRLAFWQKRGRLALLALGWIGLSLAPAFVGLAYSYVHLASRLFYAPALAVVLLWVAALWPSQPGRGGWRRWLGPIVLLAIVGQSVWLLNDFSQVFERGLTHLNEAISVMDGDGEDGRYLFVNFPDRYQVKKRPYPFGYWGLTLAPVVVDLADFVPIVTGGAAQSVSRSMPWIDAEGRDSGPYEVDMRGVIAQPGELYQLAVGRDAVYLSRYGEDDGRFTLQLAGSLAPQSAGVDCLTRFDEIVCLHAVDVVQTEAGYDVSLAWSTERALPPDLTIFVHLGPAGQPPLAQADGDTWRGILPLADWRPGDVIYERRILSYPAESDALAVQIGLYNRLNGTRLMTDDGADSFFVPLAVR